VTAPNGSKVAQTMSDMMLMAATTPEDIVEARLIVELGTVSLACARATDDDLAALRELSDRAEAALAAGTYTRDLSWDFHALLARAAHNGAVDGLTQSFRSSLSMHPMRVREGSRAYERTVDEHRAILDALVRRDGTSARREMAEHLLRGTIQQDRSKALLELWDSQPRTRRAK
jgi:DNA-binding FadR family transcriptional regulator